MAYIKITSGQQEPYSIGKLRRDNPNVSFPKIVPDHILNEYSVYTVVTAEQPTFDEVTQVCTRNDVATDVAGQWTYEWTVRDKTAEEMQTYVDGLANAARSKRDGLLAATDWSANTDVVISDEMKAYRQALRDVPQQAGFPDNITWPVNPMENN